MATSKIEKVTNNSGSDSNGTYCKMPDGTLICFGDCSVNANEWLNTFSFPVPFVDTNYSVSLQPKETGTDWNIGTKFANRVQIGRSPNTATNTYSYIAIGRWK